VSFHEIWREIFRKVQEDSVQVETPMQDQISDTPNSEDTRRIFKQASNSSIVVIDEFDRLDETTASLALWAT
jgi:hypothetical protein